MDSRKVISFLKQYGQQQSFETIRDNVDPDMTRDDLSKLVEDGKIKEVDGGVNSGGMKQVHYMAADDDD
jgi:ribosomal protein L19E